MPNDVVTAVIASAVTILITIAGAVTRWLLHRPVQTADVTAKWADTQAQLLIQVNDLQKGNYKLQKSNEKLQHSLDTNIHELGETRRGLNETKYVLRAVVAAIDAVVPLLQQLADSEDDVQRLNRAVGLARKAFNGNGSEAH